MLMALYDLQTFSRGKATLSRIFFYAITNILHMLTKKRDKKMLYYVCQASSSSLCKETLNAHRLNK